LSDFDDVVLRCDSPEDASSPIELGVSTLFWLVSRVILRDEFAEAIFWISGGFSLLPSSTKSRKPMADGVDT